MRKHFSSLLAVGTVLVLAVLACDWLPTTVTQPPIPPTETPLPLPATDTPEPVIPTDTPEISTVTPYPIIVNPAIIFLDMLDEFNGWALSDLYVLRTNDGGATWLSVTPPGVVGLGYPASAFFMNTMNAWVLLPIDATSGTLYQTSNGGVTWIEIPVPFSNGDLQFLDPANGSVLASLGAGAGSEAVALYRTSDGGATWSQVYVNDPTLPGASNSLPLGGQKFGLSFIDLNHGWVGGAQPMEGFTYFYTTRDGGTTWAQQVLSLPAGFETSMTEFDAPFFFNSTDGITHVRLFSGGDVFTVIYLTFDGGQTWAHTFTIQAFGQCSFGSIFDVFLWDGGGNLYYSNDSGLTWNTTVPNINVSDTLMRIEFVNATTGWALTGDASEHHSLYRTTDGGTTWVPLIP
ncbi:MAG: hypothetical protein JXB85_08085 [Anaerolineales bacterium]|nr:hypothetical protein [Anaerolineales bacterium]